MPMQNYDIRTHNLLEKIKTLNLRQEIPFNQEEIVKRLKKIDIILEKKEIKEIERIEDFKELASSAYLASVDYNFREFIYSFEWNLKNKGNDNDKKFLEIQQLLLECKEYGLGYAFRNKDILYIFQTPILQIVNNRYHSIIKPAIYFDDNNKLYYLYGIKFEQSEWEDVVNGKLSIKEILLWTNTEKQRAAMATISEDRFLRELQPKEINRNERGDILYEVEGIISKSLRIAKYYDWSTKRVYVKFVRPDFDTIDEVLAQKHKINIENWLSNTIHA